MAEIYSRNGARALIRERCDAGKPAVKDARNRDGAGRQALLPRLKIRLRSIISGALDRRVESRNQIS